MFYERNLSSLLLLKSPISLWFALRSKFCYLEYLTVKFSSNLDKKKNPQFFNKKSPRLKFICSSIDNSQFLNWKSPNWFFGQKFPSLELRVHLWPSTKPPRHLSKPRQALPSLDKPCVTKPLWTSIEFWKYCRRASLLFFLLSVDSRYPSVILLLFSKILIF